MTADSPPPATPPGDAERVARLRAQLPATDAGIYLNAGTAGPLPLTTLAAMREVEDHEVRFGRASVEAYEECLARMAEARAVVAALVGGDPARIALTHSTTDGMNVAAWSIDWQPGDEVVTTSLEHHGVIAPLATIRDRYGVVLRVADIGDGGDDGRTLSAIGEALSPRTRLVVASHVTWLTGSVLPVRRIGALAREAGAWYAVDGAQAAGAIPVDVGTVGADFYALSAQKWLLGPEGMGALHVSPRAMAEARGSWAGYFTFASLRPGGEVEPWPGARRFDATSFHRPSVAGFARSVGWLEMHVELAWAHERSVRLARSTADALAAIPGVTLLTPRGRMATLVAFRVAGWQPGQAARALSRRAFAVVRTLPAVDALRASVGWFNSEEELARFTEAVSLVARSTPESLPDRPPLIVFRG
jgi:L-cysteine/cystine lyase